MDINVIVASISAAVGIAIGWLGARYWYISCYQPLVNNLMAQLENWNQHSIEHEQELRDMAKEMGYKPEVIGEHITEPEDYRGGDNDQQYQQRKLEHSETGKYERPPGWVPPENLQLTIEDGIDDKKKKSWYEWLASEQLVAEIGSPMYKEWEKVYEKVQPATTPKHEWKDRWLLTSILLLVMMMLGSCNNKSGDTVQGINYRGAYCEYDMGTFRNDIIDTCGKYQIGDTIDLIKHGNKVHDTIYTDTNNSHSKIQ